MPCSTVSSVGVALGPVTADRSGFGVWGRLAGSGEIWARWCLVWFWFAGPVDDGGWTMAIRIMDDTMTVEAGNRVVATALAGERAARRG